MLINRCFNIGNYITMIQGTNISPRVSQYKNCWEWEYTTFTCYTYRSKYLKCNRLPKLEYYRNIA